MYDPILIPKEDPPPAAAPPWNHTARHTARHGAAMRHPPHNPPHDDPCGDPVRASDHDRDTTAERLGDALADGALDTAEHRRRLQQALTATTRGDLHRLTADLPPSQTARTRTEHARRAAQDEADERAWAAEWRYWTGGAAVMTAIWAATALRAGEWTFYWPAAPLAIWAAILISYAIWPARDD
jgi:hypothetical protein